MTLIGALLERFSLGGSIQFNCIQPPKLNLSLLIAAMFCVRTD